jgi:hypothetical protein
MVQATEPRIQQSTSLLSRHLRALKFMANEDGDTNLSATVRKLIEREMRQRLGFNWASELESKEAA